MSPKRLPLLVLFAAISGCTFNEKPTVEIISTPKPFMCADRDKDGAIHISPCDPREADPK